MLQEWRERPLGESTYLYMDARFEKVRQAGQVRDAAVLIATGITPEGERQVLGVSVSLSEHESHWKSFLKGLKDRGMNGVELVISDDHEGLGAARRAVLGSIPWQRCHFHLQQNAGAYVPKQAMRMEVAATNEAVRREVVQMRRVAVELMAADDLAGAFALLDAGKVQAVAGDDVLLLGQVVRTGKRRDYAIVGEYLSFERYGLAFARGDAAFAELVEGKLGELAAAKELKRTYEKWFVRTLPNGERLGLPMGAELRRSFEILGQPPE